MCACKTEFTHIHVRLNFESGENRKYLLKLRIDFDRFLQFPYYNFIHNHILRKAVPVIDRIIKDDGPPGSCALN